MPAIVWKGYVSFGLVTFPVRLFTAARADHVRFHMLHRDDLSRVKEVWFCAEEDKPIDRSDIVKGYEAAKGEYVVVEEEELKKIAPPTATTMEIVQFVREDEVDPLYFENSYYVGADEHAGKPYQLFLQALLQTKYHAIARLTMHSREHVVLIRPNGEGMVLHTLYYPNELREGSRPASQPQSKVTAKELELAKSLVQHLAGPFKPSGFHDTYRESVEHLIEQKQKGQKITAVPKPRKSKVIDLMEALKQSLAANAAPAARAKSKTAAAKKAKKAKAA